MNTIKVMGIDIPRSEDCKRCGKKDACSFQSYAYSQPCNDCKNTPEYEAEQKAHKKQRSMDDMLKVNQVAGVFEGYGRNFFVNHKGDVIRDEPAKPLPNGRKDWK